MKVKDRATREKNYRAAIPQVASKYRDAVQKTTGVIEASLRAQSLYEEMMRREEILRRRAQGLQKVTDADWQRATIDKGAARIGPGMEAGAAKQVQNYEPIAQALEALSLPDRTADPIANIDNRVKPVVLTMKKAAGKL